MTVQPTGSSFDHAASLSALTKRNERDSLFTRAAVLAVVQHLQTARHASQIKSHDATPGWATQPHSTRTLSSDDRSRGTTLPLSGSDRNHIVRTEAAQPTNGAEAHTHRNLPHHPLVTASAQNNKNDKSGDVTVTIPGPAARKLGLLGPKEKDHPVTASMPKSMAEQLGLASAGSDKRRLSASATSDSPGKASSEARQKAGLE